MQKRGVGEKSRGKIGLQNKTEVKGYISTMEDTSFAVTNKETGQVTTIPYADVEKIGGPGLSKSTKIWITVGVGVGIVFIICQQQSENGESDYSFELRFFEKE